tara:strand:+ start:806 stop:1027 length:222 start_codon:yes stop_codon:yes gene_type:complete
MSLPIDNTIFVLRAKYSFGGLLTQGKIYRGTFSDISDGAGTKGFHIRNNYGNSGWYFASRFNIVETMERSDDV